MSLVITIAVNRLATMPMLRVTANPFTGPVPNWKRTRAAIRVVMLASRIVERALPLFARFNGIKQS